MAPIHQVTSLDVVLLLSGLWLLSKCLRLLRRRAKSTYLKGPASKSFVFGVSRWLSERKDADASLVLEEWAEQYGAVFRMPIPMGRTQVVLFDPKAIQHVYSKREAGYIQPPATTIFIADMIGNGILCAEGESHKRQRKALTPAFSNAAIRKLAPVFLDSAYKVKAAWDVLLESSIDGDAIIDVQGWMNHVSLDTVGIAGFSRDFGTLQGNHSAIAEVFESFVMLKQTFFQIAVFILSTAFPILILTPNPGGTLYRNSVRTQRKSQGSCSRQPERRRMGLVKARETIP
ncbi:hypothetical protein PILCRDRAFT_813191 [Piloderma croceum F 1598]|uniref:Cytochrome P450 n=1 Tax=Piloderma croceum (strain F 1598) TaxID=765440 RepID=A0A0C3FYK3_PILCF|nr:hypothetical protein PILCRDRAFT_813191 [Piloderma croceum F 1598]